MKTPPCKIGDTMYHLSKLCNTNEWVIDKHAVTNVLWSETKGFKIQFNGLHGTFATSRIGKELFYTEQAAEEKRRRS